MQFHVKYQLIVCFACLLVSACGGQPQPRIIGGDIADLRAFPQNLQVYADQVGPDRPLLTGEAREAQWRRYRQLYFAPWNTTTASVKAEDAFAPLTPGYAENLLPREEADMAALVRNSDREHYPNRPGDQRYGVVLRQTALRAAPTERPRFNNPNTAGQGFPFDMWQDAFLPVGMPVYMTHTSLDGAWIFVENALVAGWVSADDASLIDAATRELIRRQPLLAVVRDNAPLVDQHGNRVANVSIGTLLPVLDSAPGRARVILPRVDERGQAGYTPVFVAPEDALPAPLDLTPGGIAAVGNELMGQLYGWGSLYQNRDCSAMLRDLFTPFGIWLPRNSAAQAKAWRYTDFADQTPEAREALVESRGKPFATLLSFPGHIALYLGQYQGRPAMFHNMWGVRTETHGVEGRYIVGKATVTSLRPGQELPDLQNKEGLVGRMRGMSVLEAR